MELSDSSCVLIENPEADKCQIVDQCFEAMERVLKNENVGSIFDYVLRRPIQPTAGAYYAGESDPFATLQKTLAKRAAINSEEDFRVLTLAENVHNETTAASSSFEHIPTAKESSRNSNEIQNPDTSSSVENLKQRSSSSKPPPQKFKRLKPPVVNKEPDYNLL